MTRHREAAYNRLRAIGESHMVGTGLKESEASDVPKQFRMKDLCGDVAVVSSLQLSEGQNQRCATDSSEHSDQSAHYATTQDLDLVDCRLHDCESLGIRNFTLNQDENGNYVNYGLVHQCEIDMHTTNGQLHHNNDTERDPEELEIHLNENNNKIVQFWQPSTDDESEGQENTDCDDEDFDYVEDDINFDSEVLIPDDELSAQVEQSNTGTPLNVTEQDDNHDQASYEGFLIAENATSTMDDIDEQNLNLVHSMLTEEMELENCEPDGDELVQAWIMENRKWIDLQYKRGLQETAMEDILRCLNVNGLTWAKIRKFIIRKSGLQSVVEKYLVCPVHMCFAPNFWSCS